jgi:hypothetical protein
MTEGSGPHQSRGSSPERATDDPASRDLQRRFVLQVLVWNAVLLFLALGLLLVWFRGQLELGGALIAAAVVLAGYGAIRWPAVG